MTVLSTGHDIEILITETEIAARTTQLARMIKEQYRDTEQLVVVGLLRGSFVFIADLVRRLDLPVEVDFMTVSSYCLLYTSPSPRDRSLSRMPSSA